MLRLVIASCALVSLCGGFRLPGPARHAAAGAGPVLGRTRRADGAGAAAVRGLRPLRLTEDGESDDMFLSEENVESVLTDAREKFGTLFGYSAENRAVGITGEVDLATLDGPIVVLRLSGRFWHERTQVLLRMSTYLQSRIPEIMEVTVEDPSMLDDSDKNVEAPSDADVFGL